MSTTPGYPLRPLIKLEGTRDACDYPWRCFACDGDHAPDADCPELVDAWWSLVKEPADFDGKRWARARLGLDHDPEQWVEALALTHHVHGWAQVDGGWRCVQDYYAVGTTPSTGCGATWESDPSATGRGSPTRTPRP